jgi:hypothetical protein
MGALYDVWFTDVKFDLCLLAMITTVCMYMDAECSVISGLYAVYVLITILVNDVEQIL